MLEIKIFSSKVVSPFSSNVIPEPDTTNEPVMEESPFLLPSHSWVGKFVNPLPSPTNEPEKEPLTPVAKVKSTFEPDTVKEPDISASPVNGKLLKPVKPLPSPSKLPEKEPDRLLPDA